MSTLYTFSDLYNQVLDNLDESSTTGTTLTVVKALMNQAHQRRLAQAPWSFMLWDRPETFTLTTGERFYVLHQEYWRPAYFFNQGTKAYMVEIPPRELAATGARWNDDTGRANYFTLASRAPVLAQPAASSTVSIASSSASDTGSSLAITVTGVTASGVTSEALTPNGTSTVTSTASFTKILNVTKAAAWTGTLTLSAGATTLLTLFAAEYGRSYQQLELLSTPDTLDTIEYRFYRLPRKLVNDSDLPDIPPPHSQILVWDTLIAYAGYNTLTGSAAVTIWKGYADEMELAMRQAFLEGQSLEARPRYVRYAGDDDLGPRIYPQS